MVMLSVCFFGGGGGEGSMLYGMARMLLGSVMFAFSMTQTVKQYLILRNNGKQMNTDHLNNAIETILNITYK